VGLPTPTGRGATLRKRQEQVSEEVKRSLGSTTTVTWTVSEVLAKGKNKGVVVTAVGRELLGFYLAIGTKSRSRAERIAAAGGLR